jgi:hypothetical protein
MGRIALRTQRVALAAQPLDCTVLRFQHRHHGSKASLKLGGILQRLGGVEQHGSIILAAIGQMHSRPSAGQ